MMGLSGRHHRRATERNGAPSTVVASIAVCSRANHFGKCAGTKSRAYVVGCVPSVAGPLPGAKRGAPRKRFQAAVLSVGVRWRDDGDGAPLILLYDTPVQNEESQHRDDKDWLRPPSSG